MLPIKKKMTYYFTYFYMILYDFLSCPASVDIKQTSRYKLTLE